MERLKSAITDPRLRVRGMYFLVLALGILFSLLILIYSGRVLEDSRQLVRSHLPLLDRITSLKVEISRQEAALYDYYATGEMQRFERDYGRSRTAALALLDEIARNYGAAEPVPTVRTLLERLDGVARNLEPGLSIVPRPLGETSPVLAHASGLVRELQAELDGLAGIIENRASLSASGTQDTVRRMAQLAILFSIAVFLIAAVVGYYINLYLRASVERRRLAVFAERNPNPVMRLSLNGDIIYANAAAHELAQRMGSDVRVLLPEDLRERLARLRGTVERYEVWQYDRESRSFECGVHFLPDLDIFHVYVADVTERRLNEEKLVFQAYHHPLTGLPNRRMFQEVVEQTLLAPEHGGRQAAVLVVGVDRFKVVTDTLGHELGEQLLQALATRLGLALDECRDSYAPNATLYQFESDVFAVFVPGVSSNQAPAQVAEKLVGRSARPLYVGGREFFLGFSIGIALFPADGKDAAELVRNATSAMQRVRAQGGRAFNLYKPDMNALAVHWLTLESYLRHAIERNELKLYYQPQVDVRSGAIVAFEALLRWEHPERGTLTPKEFVRLAEESGMILAIGDWVLRNACAQNRAWRDRGVVATTIAINVSARQFHRQNLPALIGAALAEARLPPEALEIEITESVAMEDVERTVAMLRELKDMGVRLAIDDFGTGFSSLAYLRRFPLDKLKIDQSFVQHVTGDGADAAIVRAVVTLGHALALRVSAEGVERPEQLARLREFECDEAQGELYTRPLPAHAVKSLLHAHRFESYARA